MNQLSIKEQLTLGKQIYKDVQEVILPNIGYISALSKKLQTTNSRESEIFWEEHSEELKTNARKLKEVVKSYNEVREYENPAGGKTVQEYFKMIDMHNQEEQFGSLFAVLINANSIVHAILYEGVGINGGYSVRNNILDEDVRSNLINILNIKD